MSPWQLGRIYLDMLNVYKVLSENISSAVSLNGNDCVFVRNVHEVCTRCCIYMYMIVYNYTVHNK